MKEVCTLGGWMAGLLTVGGVCAVADHLLHHSDALGGPGEVLLFLGVGVLGALLGRSAG
jgi:hypothetical protein